MTHDVVDRLVREESGRVLATLVRITGDFALAEEAVQEALVSALTTWPTRGVPQNPRAWVVTTARNLTIDLIRRRKRFTDRTAVLTQLAELRAPGTPEDAMGAYPDERLKLLFTCCHPALDPASRIALTLRAVGGLTAEEIARAFLVTRTTMQQRIVRAKRRITDARVPYEVPEPERFAERLHAVLHVVYLIFTEGYGATGGEALVRHDLAEEALHLGRMLRTLCPEEPEVAGLLALMLLHHSRRDARAEDGEVVLLEDQDRSRWDRAAIEEGCELVRTCLRPDPGPYAVQAAISALHAEAPSWEDTDWAQIEGLYRVLRVRVPGPVVELNHAVAVAMAHGIPAGLALFEGLEAPLAGYHLFHSARGALLMKSGRPAEARAAYERALALVGNDPERRFVERRLADLTD